MTGLLPPFDTATVQSIQSAMVTLPDTDVVGDQVMVRPHIARYADSVLPFTRIGFTIPSSVLAPGICSIRKIPLDPGLPDNSPLLAEGIQELLEISPLPFFIEPILRGIPGGTPVFYFGIPAAAQNAFEENDTLDQGQLLGSTSLFYFAVIFQDRVCLEPWGWGGIIEKALDAAGEDASAWINFLGALFPANGTRILKVLDHAGRPLSPTQFTISVNGLPQSVTSGPGGILDLSFSAGSAATINWSGNTRPGENISLPVMTFYETGLSANPDTLLQVEATFNRGHLQVFELANWFCEPPGGSAMKRYHTASSLLPLFDGYKTFRMIGSDMINCVPAANNPPPAGDMPGAHFAGWGFKEFVLDDKLLDSEGKPYTYAGLVRHLVDNNSEVCALVNKLFSVPGELDNEVQINALLMVILLTDVVLIASVTGVVESNAVGKIILVGSQILAPFGIMQLTDINTLLEDAMDQSSEMFPLFNEIKDGIAIRSIYPASLADNPLSTSITIPTPSPITITDFLTGTGTWHQKIQLFKRAQGKFDEDGNQFIGYVGGMDMNGNRLDNFGRQGRSAYHDVHCRVTGPAVGDIFKSWDERFQYESTLAANADVIATVFDPPTPAQLPENNDARHIIQIGRTLFKPTAPGSAHSLPFALQGDNTINQNIIRALREAREYIYIEDQYFVPNETTINAAYLDALLEAADHCKRLVVITPGIMTLADIPFGHERRADVTSRLLTRWGRRALIGAPMRRPILPSPGGVTHEGRCILYEAITGLSADIKIGPKARLPKSLPFWIWINGELMLATALINENEVIDGHPVIKLKVIRGAEGVNARWGAFTREHPKGSAVTASQLRGIFVHAKTMMVDDLHVYIGSANINRRGLFYDGEIGAFAVPEQLKAAPDNPARILRTGLWAEQLGLPPSMGAALLHDPIAAFELFRRHFLGGNRFVPLKMFDFNDDPDLKFSINPNLLVNALSNLGMGWLVSERDKLYNTITDPTTFDDPQPTPGP